jgi:hypothetical protein
MCMSWSVAHWCTICVSVILDWSLMHTIAVSVILDGLPMHPRCRRVIALCRLTGGMSTLSSGGSAVPGVC